MAVVSPFAQIQDSLPPLTPMPPPIDASGLGGDQPSSVFASPAPKVSLDQNPAHQIKGAFANGNPSEAISLHEQQKLAGDYEKDANPYGSANNHPGFWGKVAHGLNVATGGENRRNWEEMGLQKSLQELLKEQSTEAEQGAQTSHLNEETAEMPRKTQSEEDLQGAQKGNLESETRDRDLTASQGPPLASAYAHAVNEALKAGRDPAQDPIVQHLSDAITSIQKQSASKGAHFIQREVGGKPHTVAVDDLTGADIRDEGETGEKPPVVNVNAATSALDRETARFAKPYEKAVSDANTQLDKIADARSMINGSAEAQALGVPKVLTALVSGAGSGVRITQPELNAIAKARGLSGDIEGTINSWSGQGKLTATQKQQLTGILDDVKNRILAKQQIHNDALDKINGAKDRNEVLQVEKDVRKQLSDVEQNGAQPTRPAHVPEGYVYKDGPKGKGWYAPTAK